MEHSGAALCEGIEGTRVRWRLAVAGGKAYIESAQRCPQGPFHEGAASATASAPSIASSASSLSASASVSSSG